MDNTKNTFGFEPSKKHSTMTTEYKPELNPTELCTDTEKAQYWQCISEIQWSVTLGQIDIMNANIFILVTSLPPARSTSTIFSIYMTI